MRTGHTCVHTHVRTQALTGEHRHVHTLKCDLSASEKDTQPVSMFKDAYLHKEPSANKNNNEVLLPIESVKIEDR